MNTLVKDASYIRNIGLAPDNRIFISGHWKEMKALGLYYPDIPAQWAMVQKVIERGFADGVSTGEIGAGRNGAHLSHTGLSSGQTLLGNGQYRSGCRSPVCIFGSTCRAAESGRQFVRVGDKGSFSIAVTLIIVTHWSYLFLYPVRNGHCRLIETID